ncbi:hypothetical protein [Reyranella sp.]|uniref:hypothetical protein n=1 Tax=Reyranella sp. TaxID=1929291 RepID=UPI003BA85114
MTVDLRAGRTGDGRAVEWVTRSTPICVRALQIMVAIEPSDLGFTAAEAEALTAQSPLPARSGEPLLFARTEG